MPVNEPNNESGFTMIATIIAMSVIMLLAVVTVAAVNGDTSLTRNDLNRKQAFEAAKAGIDDYAFHLNANKTYWTECAGVPAPNAVNLKGSTAKQRPVPGSTGATYAIELLPSESQSTYTQCNTTKPAASMLETSGTLPGSFRIRSTGFAGKSKTSIVATFKPPSFLDYLYFTQRETLDPVTFGYANPSAALTGAYAQCSLSYEEGRNNSPIPGTNGDDYCVTISFGGNDVIEGPLHSNDSIAINGKPTLGRSPSDMIEVSADAPGWYGISSGSKPNFVGTFVTNAAELIPPESNSQLAAIVQSTFKYTGQVWICLSGNNMTVGTNGTCTGKYSGAIPSNGVVYVANGTCSTTYSPFTATYSTSSTEKCGNAYVSATGGYSSQLTIAAENDVIVNGSVIREGEGLLGLIANNFVRIYHNYPSQTGTGKCGSVGSNEVRLKNVEVDAAILAINHSFIVDHYDCGSSMGTLTVEGAIAQKFRGPVGTGSATSTSSGYAKNYIYDDRLRYTEPPNFIDPAPTSWVIGRETTD